MEVFGNLVKKITRTIDDDSGGGSNGQSRIIVV